MADNSRERPVRVVFEGLPGAGKTTISQRVARELGLPLVPEYVGFNDAEWRTHPLKTPFYFANDEVKEYLASYLSSHVVLMDRHYVGALAFGFALSEVRGATLADDESFEGNIDWYRKQVVAGGLRRPDVVLFLDIPPEASLLRQPRARRSDEIWGDTRCLDAMRRYYFSFYMDEEPDVEFIVLDGTIEQEEVYARARDLVLSRLDFARFSAEAS